MKLTEQQKINRKELREKRIADAKVGKLKRTVKYVDISHLSYREWQIYRKNYIGGSDVATILEGNLNPYQSKLELFHQKVGVFTPAGEETEATFSGHCMEDYIIDNYWRFHNMADPTHEARMERFKKGLKSGPRRYCRRVKDKMMYDPRFPWLMINIDGFIQNSRFERQPRGILECKSGLGYVWAEYEAGIPVFYIIQAQAYMLVTGIKYTEIAVLLDGRYFKVIPIEANKDIQATILEQTKAFWSLVLEGRQIWEDDTLNEDEKHQFLSTIEPPIDNSKSLDRYLKLRFRSDYKVGKMLVTPELATLGKEYLACNAGINKIEVERTGKTNAIKNIFLNNKVDEVIDGNDKILMTNRITGKNKTPTLNVKAEVAKL